jgi:tripartite-type tricarboxylate transporter receptor subunit TctC
LEQDLVAKSSADGHTVDAANATSYSIHRAVLLRLPYNIDRDSSLVAQLTTQPNLQGVAMFLTVKSLRELIDHTQRNTGTLLYASSGVGSGLRAAAELFCQMTDTRMAHVPFKITPQANTELILGQTRLMFNSLSRLASEGRACPRNRDDKRPPLDAAPATYPPSQRRMCLFVRLRSGAAWWRL